jgi:DNA-binding NtrC family response regulator
MNPIIIVENNRAFKLLYRAIFNELKLNNQVLFFSTTTEALQYISTTLEKPLLIVCNQELPRAKGLTLKEKINENKALKSKNIPFVLFTERATREEVNQAYQLGVAGFFEKNTDFEHLKYNFETIMGYTHHTVDAGIGANSQVA